MKKTLSGFTVVELAIVIVVVGVLVTLVIASYNGTQAQTRDAKRISDMAKIADAVTLFRIKNGNDVNSTAGCGSGNGWFNYADPSAVAGASYYRSVLSCLVTAGYLDESFIDPSGCTTLTSSAGSGLASPSCDSSIGRGYMKYSCVQNGETVTYVYTKLETGGNNEDVLNSGGCQASFVGNTTYQMNYFVKAD